MMTGVPSRSPRSFAPRVSLREPISRALGHHDTRLRRRTRNISDSSRFSGPVVYESAVNPYIWAPISIAEVDMAYGFARHMLDRVLIKSSQARKCQAPSVSEHARSHCLARSKSGLAAVLECSDSRLVTNLARLLFPLAFLCTSAHTFDARSGADLGGLQKPFPRRYSARGTLHARELW